MTMANISKWVLSGTGPIWYRCFLGQHLDNGAYGPPYWHHVLTIGPITFSWKTKEVKYDKSNPL